MKAILEIDMDNAAFEENGPESELSRILSRLSDDVIRHRIYGGGDFVTAVDINGNTVGKLEIICPDKGFPEENESVKRYQKTQEFFNDTENPKEVKQWW
jgi:hypothetical protein